MQRDLEKNLLMVPLLVNSMSFCLLFVTQIFFVFNIFQKQNVYIEKNNKWNNNLAWFQQYSRYETITFIEMYMYSTSIKL